MRRLLPARVRRPRTSAGFSLLEMLISLVLLMVALFLAADLISEAGTLLAASAREVVDAPASLVLARLRGDIMAASDFRAPLMTWSFGPLMLTGHPQGNVKFERVGSELRRSLVTEDGYPIGGEVVVLHGVTDWNWRPLAVWGTMMLEVDVSYRRFAVPPSPLPNLPRYRGPRSEIVHENLLVVPRGNGLGYRW